MIPAGEFISIEGAYCKCRSVYGDEIAKLFGHSTRYMLAHASVLKAEGLRCMYCGQLMTFVWRDATQEEITGVLARPSA